MLILPSVVCAGVAKLVIFYKLADSTFSPPHPTPPHLLQTAVSHPTDTCKLPGTAAGDVDITCTYCSHPCKPNPHSPRTRSSHTNRLLAHARIITRHRRRLPTSAPAHLHGYTCKEYILESTHHVITLFESQQQRQCRSHGIC